METASPSIRPTDLAVKLGISVPYASQLLSGERKPSLEKAVEFYDKAGVKLGPIKNATEEQIATIRALSA